VTGARESQNRNPRFETHDGGNRKPSRPDTKEGVDVSRECKVYGWGQSSKEENKKTPAKLLVLKEETNKGIERRPSLRRLIEEMRT